MGGGRRRDVSSRKAVSARCVKKGGERYKARHKKGSTAPLSAVRGLGGGKKEGEELSPKKHNLETEKLGKSGEKRGSGRTRLPSLYYEKGKKRGYRRQQLPFHITERKAL